MRILAVDDNPFMQDFLPAILREAQFPHVTVADSGQEALDILAAAAEPFDCLLLDIVMPGMDGISLCRQIRLMPEYRTTPVIMLTLKSDAGSIEQAFSAGANDYVVKPFEVREIARRLRVAERLLESSEVALRLDPQLMLRDGPPGSHAFALAAPLHILGVHQLVLPFSLGNYLAQLSRKHLDICQVFAAQIDNIGSIYHECSTRDYALTIASVARAIGRVVGCPQLLMSHNGGGTLIGISTQESLPAWPRIEALVQAELEMMAPESEALLNNPARVSIGRPIQPYANRTQRVQRTFERAVERLAGRQKSKHSIPLAHTPAVSSAR